MLFFPWWNSELFNVQRAISLEKAVEGSVYFFFVGCFLPLGLSICKSTYWILYSGYLLINRQFCSCWVQMENDAAEKFARLKLEVLSCSHLYLITPLNKPEELQDLSSHISLIVEFIWEVTLPLTQKTRKAGIKVIWPILTRCCKFLKCWQPHFTNNLHIWSLVTDFNAH